MSNVTIKANGQTLSMSSEDVLALEAALIQARNAPNQEVTRMTNNGVILVAFNGESGRHFSRAIKPSDGILSPLPKPLVALNEFKTTDC